MSDRITSAGAVRTNRRQPLTHAEFQQRLHDGIVSIAQTLCRLRYGDNPTAEEISIATNQATSLLNATYGERLAAQVELLRRYGVEGA